MPRHPKTAVPATRSSLPQLQIRRRLVLGALALAVLSGIISLVLTLAFRPQAAPVTGHDERAAAVAEVAVHDFLARRNSSVPAADGVDTAWAPDTTSGEAPPKPLEVGTVTLAGVSTQRLGDAANQQVDLVKFLAVIGGAPYEVTVPVTVDAAADSPVLAGQPSLVPAKFAKTDTGKAADFSGYGSSEDGSALPAPVRASIERWATTFASEGANSEKLRTVTGDQDQSRTYSGLGGWTAKVTGIGDFVPATDEVHGAGLVAQVSLALTPPAANGPTLNTAYDVYVLYTGSEAQPPVVAWGPAGSAAELKPYTYNANKS